MVISKGMHGHMHLDAIARCPGMRIEGDRVVRDTGWNSNDAADALIELCMCFSLHMGMDGTWVECEAIRGL